MDAANARVYPLSLATSTLGGAITVGAQGDPTAMVVTPNGAQVFVADYGAHQVSAIDTSTDVVTNIAVGGTTGIPIALAVTPNSGHVYVADEGSSQIDDITTSSDTVSATIAVPSLADTDGFVPNGGDPNILAVTPDGAKVYVASFGGGSVEDITTSNDAVATTFALPPGGVLGPAAPNALALTPNGCQRRLHHSGRPDRRSDRDGGDPERRGGVRGQLLRPQRERHRHQQLHGDPDRRDGERQRSVRDRHHSQFLLLRGGGNARGLDERPQLAGHVHARLERRRLAVMGRRLRRD